MDILTDILNSAGLHKSLLVRRAIYKPWAIRFPCVKSMGFHVVTHGKVYVRASRFSEPLALERGDIVLMKRGFDHEIATDPDLPSATQSVDESNPVVVTADTPDAKPLAVLVCGVYQFQTPPIHPLFAELPEVLVIRASEIASHSPLYAAQQLLAAEMAQSESEQGTDSVVKSLVDVMFQYILRDWLNRKADRESAGPSHWSQVLRDTHLSRAIQAVHAQPESTWTLDVLARTAGLSRAALAQRFKRLAGDTPAHYIAKVRVQRAMDLLRATDDSVERIAQRVGYGDPFVFSKVFKRIQGVSPRQFRTSLAQTA
ncbi:MAG: AraC family transcriptional regulator [Fibrobacteria bacterium]